MTDRDRTQVFEVNAEITLDAAAGGGGGGGRMWVWGKGGGGSSLSLIGVRRGRG